MDRSLIVTSIIDDRDHPILRSLCEVTNSVIADGSGIGWTEPFDDPIALLPYFSERASAANVSLVVAHTQDNVALGSVQLCDNKEKFRCEACAHRAEISCFFVSKSVRGKGVGFEVRQSEERSDGLATISLVAKIARARTSVQDAPPP